MKLVIVTGLAGSGKSIALHTLEDLGYNCIDNLPVFMLHELVKYLLNTKDQAFARTAVGIDARNAQEGLLALPPLVKQLKAQGIACKIVFLDAKPEILSQRFSETRRKHPLASANRSLEEAMQLERELMTQVFGRPDLYIDTTHTTIHQLRDQIRVRLGGIDTSLSILLMSFGFKHGVPRDADFVFDVRCLPNPHWQPALRHYTGKDVPVIEFLKASPGVNEMLDDLIRFLDRWIPTFETDGRSYLTITIGCTGGQHRSVYITEALGKHLSNSGRSMLIRHRELSA